MALHSGRFPTVTARRLRNIVVECFAPHYLINRGALAAHLQRLAPGLPANEFNQFLLLFTSRVNPILGDFIRQVYWARYAGGCVEIGNNDAHAFVARAIDDGLTIKRWSESTVRRVSAYLTGCCADYGLLEAGRKSHRRILPFRLSCRLAAYLAYDLHFAGCGDNALLNHPDWGLFGLGREDVLGEMKKLSLKACSACRRWVTSSASVGNTPTWRRCAMSSLKADFDELCERIRHGRELGHASFEPIYYLIFPPSQILAVKRQTPAWIAKLRWEGSEVTPTPEQDQADPASRLLHLPWADHGRGRTRPRSAGSRP